VAVSFEEVTLLRRTVFLFLSVCAVAISSAPVSAEVMSVGPSGFAVKHEVAVKAAPGPVYDALTVKVGSWWNPDHTFSHDAKNLSIAAVPGGCFCERFPYSGGVQHMTVVYASPGKALRMTGALGPLQGLGLAGSMTWDLAKSETGTKLVVTYGVGGYMPGGFEKIAPIVDAVVGEQVGRLKTFLETGSPVQK
jgi:uncharacterized protein YndB with AHSA1/START domain